MIKLVQSNSILLQAYLDFKRKFYVEELTPREILEHGFTIKYEYEQNRTLLDEAKMNSIKFERNFHKWVFCHKEPAHPFVFEDPAQKTFSFMQLEMMDIKMVYDTETHQQTFEFHKMKPLQYDMIESTIAIVRNQKKMLTALNQSFKILNEADADLPDTDKLTVEWGV